MEQPTVYLGSSSSQGEVEACGMLSLETALRRASNAERVASGDAWLTVREAMKVLTRLREVAPDLLAAVELEVATGVHQL